MLTTTYNKTGLFFEGDQLEENIRADEAMHNNKLSTSTHFYDILEKGHTKRKKKVVNSFNWHSLITRTDEPFKEHKVFPILNNWGLNVETPNFVLDTLESKKRKYGSEGISLIDYENKPAYKLAFQRIQNAYSGKLSDGRHVFEYQKAGAALIGSKKRLVLGFDMGLGKTMTTLIGLTSREENKKILIVTMSRNISDWEREIHLLGFQNDYIKLMNRMDMKSDKRIHLVSYEKWKQESIIFKEKEYTSCPTCNSTFYWNMKRQHCKACNKSHKNSEDLYTRDTLPEDCTRCNKTWKKGQLFCGCGYTVVKERKKVFSVLLIEVMTQLQLTRHIRLRMEQI